MNSTSRFLVALMMSALSACPATVEPCEGIDCGGRGQCVARADAPACLCEEGFRAQDTTCVPVENPCADVTCSGRGQCTTLRGGALCVCDQGSFAEGLECKPIVVGAECDGVTCNGRGTCVVLAGTPNTPKCECDADSVSAGPTTCVPRPVPDGGTGGGSTGGGSTGGGSTGGGSTGGGSTGGGSAGGGSTGGGSAGGGSAGGGSAGGGSAGGGSSGGGSAGGGSAGGTATPCSAGLIPNPTGGCTSAVAIDVGTNHACALGTAGQIACWGLNENGQLGATPGSVASSTRPRLVTGLGIATAIAVGSRHSCAVVGGGVRCWGAIATSAGPYLGQLGNGASAGSATPVTVSGLTNVQGLVASNHTTCALSSGTLRCWGFGSSGQLGNGSTPFTQTTPATAVAAPGLGAVTRVAAGESHFCAINAAGEVWCWGENVLLKVGVATGSGISTPVKVGSLAAATSLVLGRSFSCARLSDSSVWCWGEGAASNNCVSVMSPPMTSCTATHVPRVRPGFSASAVFGGSEQICGLLSPGGAPACLGIGADGLLGDGVDRSIQFVQAPQLLVAPASTATMVDFGASAGCAILSSGQVACWGANNAGQLGNGTTTTLRPSRPGFVAPL